MNVFAGSFPPDLAAQYVAYLLDLGAVISSSVPGIVTGVVVGGIAYFIWVKRAVAGLDISSGTGRAPDRGTPYNVIQPKEWTPGGCSPHDHYNYPKGK